MTSTFNFKAQYNRKDFVKFLKNTFLGDDFIPDEEIIDVDDMNFKLITKVTRLGRRNNLGSEDLEVFEVEHSSSKNNARVTLSRDAFKLMLHKSDCNYALIIFLPQEEQPQEEKRYRFSLLYINAEQKAGSYRIQRGYSNPRRYSYVLGEGIGTYTPHKYLEENGVVTSIADLRERFSVEILTKEFYSELSDWYFCATKVVQFPNDFKDKRDNTAFNSEALIRLITRLIFVWFLKQKKLIPNEFFNQNYVMNCLVEFNQNTLLGKSTESRYYKAILQNLFFAMLNSPITPEGKTTISERRFRKAGKDFDNNKVMRYKDFFYEDKAQEFVDLANKVVPFLNGGLFDCLDEKEKEIYYDAFTDRKIVQKQLIVPDYLFFGDNVGKDVDLSGVYGNPSKKIVNVPGIIRILEKYNFTVEENMPYDQEVSLDPELLGNVFENLLASYNPETQTTARKQTGSYYTPREIVQFMVDESLVAYLKRKVGEKYEQEYRDLLKYTETPCTLTDDIKAKIIQALYDCKILDPACGSGAFPMGILQQMVHLLNELDPENNQWKALLTKQTKKDAADAIDEETSEDREEALNDVKKSFDSKLTNPDYARKLYLIENCIFGVDIQSIAIQISKLRFFISLVVDQKPKYDKPEENFGIRPLPNLEAKFVAADSLIALQKNTDGSLFSNDDIEKLQDQQKKSIHWIFAAKTYKTKNKHQKKVQELGEKIASLLEESEVVGNEQAYQLGKWNRFDQNAVAPFFDPEWMFGVSDGFDIVLGNPPYRQLQANKAELGNKYQPCNFETFTSTGDIYCLFYEKSLNLLKQNGSFCLITSNKWMRAGYGEKLRNYLSAKANPLLLVDLSGVKVFQAATVDTNILLCEKSENAKNTFCAELKGFKKDCFNQLSDYVLQNRSPMNFKQVGGNSWVVLSPIEQSIKKKIESAGVPLKDWDIQINYGIKTGYNEAFIISTEKREEILSNCKTPSERKRTDQLIRPILRGRDIKRYGFDWAGLYLIAFFPSKGYDIEDYPAVKKHLLEFDKERLIESGLDDIANKKSVLHDYCQQRLEQTGEDIVINGRKVKIGGTVQKSRKRTNNQWFETQDSISYWEDFSKPKIMYPNMTQFLPFYYDTKGFYQNDKSFMITGKYTAFLTAFFNSSLFKYCFTNNFPALGEKGRELRKIFFDKIPVIPVNMQTEKIFQSLVIDIQKDYSEQKARQIDKKIFEMYKLTAEEIKTIGFIDMK